MKLRVWNLLFLSLICLARPHAFGQNSAPAEIPPPKFPLSLRAPASASWVIKKENKGKVIETENSQNSGSKAVPLVKELSVTKTSPIYFERAIVENGRSWEKWVFVTNDGTYRLIKYAGSPKWERLWETHYQDISRYENTDFEDIEWIAKDNYLGIQTVDKGPAYAFGIQSRSPLTRRDKRNVTVSEGEDGKGQIFTASTLIDVKTLLPLKIENDYEISTITYGEAPRSRLSPPAEVLEELKTWVQEVKNANR